ncbi:MAG: beta-lactamase family protein [Bacteroidales bacterium]|nr:beta-lactamase family protein [Bacteroidales bacterium]
MFKKIDRLLFILLSVIGLFSTRIIIAQNRTSDFVEINNFFDSVCMIMKTKQIDSVFKNMSNEKQFNGSLLIGKQNKILYSNFSGYADYPAKKRLNTSSQFEIASGSKQFTAIAILMLYEQKKLQLTDSIQKFLPDFPYKGITIHQLLCHRSGLPDYFKFAEIYHKNKNYFMTNDSLINMMVVYRPQILDVPDKSFGYSNTGYAILASIVERITGMLFSEFITRFIFEPTGMKESYFYYYGKNQEGGYTVGHKNNLKHYERDFLSSILGDKGIFTTAHDLYLWDNALYEAKIIDMETLQMAFSPQNADKPNCNNYGYGWRLSCDNYGNTLIYHGGLWNGNNSLFLKRPSDKTLIVILSNVYNKGFSGRSTEILSILDAL